MFARAPQTPPVLWKCVPGHCPGCCHRQGWFPTLNPLLCEWRPQEAQHPGWVAAREPPTQLDMGIPLRAALAVVSPLLGESLHPCSHHPRRSDMVSVASPYGAGGGVLWAGAHAQRCNTGQKGKEGRAKVDKRFHKKCSLVTVLDVPALLQIFTPFHLPVLRRCGEMAKGARALVGWMGGGCVRVNLCSTAAWIPKSCETGGRARHLRQHSAVRARAPAAPLAQLREALSPPSCPGPGGFCNPPPPTSGNSVVLKDFCPLP